MKIALDCASPQILILEYTSAGRRNPKQAKALDEGRYSTYEKQFQYQIFRLTDWPGLTGFSLKAPS